MTVDNTSLIIYCAIGVMVIMLAICFNLVRIVKHLERRVSGLQDDNERHVFTEIKLQERCDKTDIAINQVKGSIEVMSSGFSKDMHDIQRQLTRMETQLRKVQCELAIHGNRLYDIVTWTGMDAEEKPEVKSAVEYWADKATLADIVDPANLETPIEEEENNEEPSGDLVSYNWIFPSDDPLHGVNRPPVIGEWYLVVGTIKGLANDSGEPMIFTDEGLYNGTDFITTQDQRFDKVFAYIKKPSSVDIMKKVFALAVRERG